MNLKKSVLNITTQLKDDLLNYSLFI
jgi:hypothetical protein